MDNRRVEKISAIKPVAHDIGRFSRYRRGYPDTSGQDFDRELAWAMRKKRPAKDAGNTAEAPYILELSQNPQTDGRNYSFSVERLKHLPYEK